jgi:hypothetical protein
MFPGVERTISREDGLEVTRELEPEEEVTRELEPEEEVKREVTSTPPMHVDPHVDSVSSIQTSPKEQNWSPTRENRMSPPIVGEEAPQESEDELPDPDTLLPTQNPSKPILSNLIFPPPQNGRASLGRTTRNEKPIYKGHPSYETHRKEMERNDSNFMRSHQFLEGLLPKLQRMDRDAKLDVGILSAALPSDSDSEKEGEREVIVGEQKVSSEANAEYTGSTTRFKKPKVSGTVKTHLLANDGGDLISILSREDSILVHQFPRIVDLDSCGIGNDWKGEGVRDWDGFLECGRLDCFDDARLWVWNKSMYYFRGRLMSQCLLLIPRHSKYCSVNDIYEPFHTLLCLNRCFVSL